MAAIVGGDAAAVEELCAEARRQLDGGRVLAPANYNAPGQIVIAGHVEAVELASKLAGERRLKAISLKVSAPFHCALMAPAAAEVERALKDVEVRAPSFPVLANVDALPNTNPAGVRVRLVSQVAGAVRWQESMEWIQKHGVRLALEIGPGKVLAGLARKAAPQLDVRPVFEPSEVVAAPSATKPA